MPLTIEPPSPEDATAGIAARFEYRDDEQAVTVRGVAKRGERGLTIARLEIEPDNEDVTASLTHVATPSKPTGSGGRGGWPPLTDDHMRDVASAYLEETGSRAPGAMKRIADRFGRPEETIRTWVARARRDGWLGPSVQGRAGAEPGPLLLASKRKADVA